MLRRSKTIGGHKLTTKATDDDATGKKRIQVDLMRLSL